MLWRIVGIQAEAVRPRPLPDCNFCEKRQSFLQMDGGGKSGQDAHC